MAAPITITAVARATEKFFSWLKQWMEESEVRDLKSAAKYMRRYYRRVEKLYPESKEDRLLNKHKRAFERKIL